VSVQSIGTVWSWTGFIAFILLMLALDLGVFHRTPRSISWREALAWSLTWIGLAAAFCVGLHVSAGSGPALEFSAGFLLEKALAVDNIFVFVVIFRAFGVPAQVQHRVLRWGVLGALAMRAMFIFLGSAFIQRFHWAMYAFGGLLVFTGLRLAFEQKSETDHQPNAALRFITRLLPATSEFVGDRFTVVQNGRRYATPLLMTLVSIEVSDLIFAVDSIPAIFAVTRDPFLVFTSNIFAIMGLRSLYFVLAALIDKFVYLKPALALVLVFVGAKMALAELYPISILASVSAIACILGIALLASLWRRARPDASPVPARDAQQLAEGS